MVFLKVYWLNFLELTAENNILDGRKHLILGQCKLTVTYLITDTKW